MTEDPGREHSEPAQTPPSPLPAAPSRTIGPREIAVCIILVLLLEIISGFIWVRTWDRSNPEQAAGALSVCAPQQVVKFTGLDGSDGLLAFKLMIEMMWTGVWRLLQLAVVLTYLSVRGWGLRGVELGWATARRGIVWGCAASIAMAAAVVGAETIFRLAVHKSFLQDIILGGQPMTILRSWKVLFTLLLVQGLIGPVMEEVFFRGLIQQGMRRVAGAVPAVLISATLFAFAHYGSNLNLLLQLTGGFLFAIVYEKSRSLWAPIIVHALGNSALLLINLFFIPM
jgi:membrane protease YdiL (CAAX protease family)